MASVYDYLDYRDYLNAWIDSHSKGGHGLRKKIADHLSCQGTFISQVLHKVTHFSMEHGFKLNSFLNHNSEESDYFVLLLLYQRAGSEDVRAYFRAKIDAIHKSRLIIKNRVGAKMHLSLDDQTKYYSSWYYAAIRLLVLIPGFQTKEQIAARLKLPAMTVSSALDFLVRTGLLTEQKGKYMPGEQHLHLANDSPLITKHHSNWRVEALKAMTVERESDLHYSVAYTLSKSDVIKIKARLVELIEEMQAIVRPSDSETLCAFCFDWFEL